MPSQNIEVGLRFTADTSNASRQIAKLKDEISQAIQNVNNPKTGDLGFEKAVNQAAQLRGILDAATNDAGKLDLTKFQRGLAAAGLDMHKVYTSLHAIGAENAFGRLANQINQANVHSQMLSGTLKKFATGLKNTAMWTIQSNAIHAVQSALQGAYSYAQRLNKGLTDIAIVSDLSTDQLAAFAKSANAAAKELSTTTNEYVKGALIYYQQGLNDEEVAQRTETTIKMANASGESAETISSYMTAIWNNFDHGSESVEHYADVIALLGATTAASNADIAEGMQAFAATAETVGLSYEYSAAALTTLVDRTQQSASKIGTSLKTIFARLSSVSLGETLEDDVNLTKYTKALEKVGVDVLDATGDLKDMNEILDALGAKWDNLNQAQKVAVAQTVGGVRQYNNLISLLDNYDYFKELVGNAEEADGYLQTQQDKYAASWEGANKRVQASWETLYSQILDDKFFIGLTNTLADIIEFITDAIDGMGGLKGVISTIIALISSIHPEKFQSQIVQATQAVRALAAELSGAQLKANIQIKTESMQTALGGAVADGPYANKINSMYEQIQTWITEINDLQAKGDIAHANALLEITSRYSALADKATDYNNARQKAVADLYDTELPSSLVDAIASQTGSGDKQLAGYQNLYNDLKNSSLRQQRDILSGLKTGDGNSYGLNLNFTGLKNLIPDDVSQISEAKVNDIFNKLTTLMQNRMSKLVAKMGEGWQDLFDGDTFKLDSDKILEAFNDKDGALQDAIAGGLLNKAEDLKKQIQDAEAEKKFLEDNAETAESQTRLKDLNIELDNLRLQQEDEQAIIQKIQEKGIAEEGVQKKIAEANNLLNQQEVAEEEVAEAAKKKFDADKFAANAQSITQLVSSMSMLNSAFEGLSTNIKEGTLSFGSFTGGVTALLGSLPMLSMGLKSMMTMLEGTALAGTKFFTLMSGPWGIAIMALIAILPTLIKLIGDIVPPSVEERLETVNEQLTAQKQVVKDLASEYANLDSQIDSLTSAYDDLVEAEKKFGSNSPQYWLARAEYLDRIAELIDKYGEDIVNYDENGIPQINGEVYGQKVLSEFNTNKQYELDLEASKSQIQAENDRSYDRVTDKAGWWNVPAGGENLWKIIIGKIEEGAYTEDWAERFVRTNAEHASDETVQAFVDAATEYMKSYADADKAQSLAQQNVQDAAKEVGVYDAASMVGIEANVVDSAIDQYIQQRATNLTEEEKNILLSQAQQAYLNTHEGSELKNGTITDSEGNAVDNETLLQSQILAEMATNIQAGDQEIVNAILSNSGINGGDLLKASSMTEDQRIEADRLAGAEQDTSALGLDAEVVNQTTQAIDALVDAEENLEDSQKRFSEKTKDNEGSLKKLANAAEKTQEGFDELEEGYSDWYDAIKHGDELAKAKALAKLTDSLADIIGMTDELAESGMHLGKHFGDYITENQDVVEDALRGDSDAILELQRVAAEDIAIQIGVDEAADQELLNHVGSTMDMVQAMLDSGDLKLGAVDNSALLASLTETINAVAMDVNQAEALLASMGFDAEVEQAQATSNSDAAYWQPPVYADAQGDDFTYQKVVKPGEWVPVPHTNVTGVTALRIKTADYVGGGNILGAKGGTAAGANRVNNARGKSGGGGGGGGGGSGKSNKAKKADRYHEITDKLDQQSKKLKEISTYEERAYGAERQKYVQDHINALKTEADLYGQLADEAARYLQQDKNALSAYGTQFNADGTIKNFDSWYNKWAEKLKDDEEGLAEFEEAIKNYEESLDKVIDAKQSQLEKLNEAYDLQLQNINDTLKEQNDLIQDNLDLLEYMFDRLNDDGSDAADAIANLGDQLNQLSFKANHYETAITDLLKNAGASSKDIQNFLSGKVSIDDLAKKLKLTPEAIDNLREYANALLEINGNMYDMRDDAIDQLNKALDKFAEEADKAARKTEFYSGHLEHLKNVIDIVGKDALGVSNDILEGLSDAAFQTALREIEVARTTLDEIEYDRQKFAEQFKNGLMTEDEYNNMMDNLNDRWMNAVETLAQKEEDALEAAENVFQTHLTNIVEGFEKAMSGPYKTLDHLQDAFDKQKKLNDLYVDDYQKIHDLSKLGRDIQKSMDNTDNVKAMEYLKELQDEVNDGLRDGNQLTEYNIEFLEKKYQLRLAEIALEEAQNAKNQVRMTRTSEGDWSYTYYADEDATADAQQNYEDKLFELNQLNQEYVKNVQDLIMDNMAQYRDEIADLNLTDAERTQMLQQYYEQLQQQYGVFLNGALDDAKWIEGEFGIVDHHLVNDWNETTLAAVTNFNTLEDMQDSFMTASSAMVDDLEVTYDRWVNDWQTVLKTAGDDATNYGNQVKTESENVIEYGQDVVDAYEQQVKDQEEKVWTPALTNLDTFLTQWKKKIDDQIAKNVELVTSIDSLIRKYGELATKAEEAASKATAAAAKAQAAAQSAANAASSAANSAGSAAGSANKANNSAGSVNKPGSRQDKSGGGLGTSALMQFATGGYTGEWGNEGRIAMLDEKELVLNKTDTSNILNTVEAVRDIASQLSVNASISAAGLGELASAGIAAGTQFEQVVNITAEFPNAVYHDEIKEAFDNLLGRTAQYLLRK